MSDAFNEFGPVEWFREQFVDASAASLFRLVILSWLVAALVWIAADRLGSVLLGRSRPLAQEPPVRARAWRWGRRTPPPNYSLLPPGVAAVPVVASAVVVERPTTSPLAELPLASQPIGEVSFDDPIPDPSIALDDPEFWKLFADQESPLFGFENATKLSHGEAPERYNPVIGRVEQLARDREQSTISWPHEADSTLLIGRDE